MVKKKTRPSKKRTRPSKKKNVQLPYEEPTEVVEAPHTFVIHRGLSCPYIQDLTKDFRQILEPFTAINLKERKSNKIKDYVSLSGYFHVSHMCIFNKAATQLSFKLVRMPRGPTLTFKVHQFTLARDIISASRKQYIDQEIFQTAPLVIMNNFTGEGKHLKLMANTFQNMYPAISLATVNLATMRRCVLYSYNPVTKLVEMRHYSIVVVPVGLSRGIKKVVLGNIPNLSRCDDIADYFTQGNCFSDSEFEDEEANHVVLAQTLKRKGNLENNKSAIRLHEIGPRCTFELVKIEDGLLTGEVLYHENIIKTEEEIEQIRKTREKKNKLKEQRKKIQKENKLRNDEKKKSIQRQHNKGNQEQTTEIGHEEHAEPDNDADYYREEIGQEPDEELFKQNDPNSKKRVRLPKHINAKRRKLNDDDKKEKKTVMNDEKKRFKKDDKSLNKKGKFDRNDKKHSLSNKKKKTSFGGAKTKIGGKTKIRPGKKQKSSFKKKKY